MLRVACGTMLNTLQHTALPAAAVAGNLLLRHGQAWTLQQQLQQSLLGRFSSHAAADNKTDQGSSAAATSTTTAAGAAAGAEAARHVHHVAAHPSLQSAQACTDPDVAHAMALPVYDRDYLLSIKPHHIPPVERHQRVAYNVIQAVRKVFDVATGYGPAMTEERWLRRMVFLETVAGVPGMVAGMLRHLRSLRLMRRDAGWINTLLAEAENERMHLITFLELRKPGRLFRGTVLVAQGLMFNALFLAYLASPRTVHAMVGYLEEEAVRTYTHALEDIDAGKLWPGKPAPPFARAYWRLADDATMRDLILVVRADEACHSHVNHTFSAMKGHEPNPFGVGSHQVP